ncbi:MAG: restriction endonuclease [Burkholderiales bacterium PBB3]|nr:MAG: restriction endonuclease [Burkholderiales bacterium PBB3]
MSWPVVPLAKALDSAHVFVDGDWVESKDQDPEGDVRLIQLADIGDGYYVDKSNRFLTSDAARRLKCTFLEAGDLLIARMPDPLGRACIFPGDSKRTVTVVDVCIIRPDSNTVYTPWLMHCINSPQSRNQIDEYTTGTTRQRISRGNLTKIKVALPPLEEQRCIAAILDQAETLRTQRRQVLAHLDTLTQSLFLYMFGDPASNPNGLPRKKLGELIAEGPQNGLYKSSTEYGSGTPILRIDAFYDGVVTKLNSLKRVRLSPEEIKLFGLAAEDIVINRVNSIEYLGKSALIPPLSEPTVFESNMMRFTVRRDQVEPGYVVHFLQTPFIKGQILSGSKNAVNQSSINQQDVKGFEINVPPLPLQQTFATRIQAIEALKATHRTALAELDALFASLQQRAFAGEL